MKSWFTWKDHLELLKICSLIISYSQNLGLKSKKKKKKKKFWTAEPQIRAFACMTVDVFDMGSSYLLCEIVVNLIRKKLANKLHNLSLKIHFKVYGRNEKIPVPVELRGPNVKLAYT